MIARNERRFLGFGSDDMGFDPDRYPGKVVVSTMHRAKGLEWDRVYLMSVNNYDFPSAMDGDTYISEKWFLRDQLNLEAEALAQLQAALEVDEYSWYEPGQATLEAAAGLHPRAAAPALCGPDPRPPRAGGDLEQRARWQAPTCHAAGCIAELLGGAKKWRLSGCKAACGKA